ncbi:MAG: phosphatidate cytidylyltransferase [Clostridia bacterium]|nr:phosphatidate cytidylyltransferase [Clostridia bacterium]MDD4276130.1 phosphatidate cytidylyltransferase [Clostridia bacterium]
MKKRTITGLILVACLLSILALRFVSIYIFDAFIMAITICCIIEVVKAYKVGGNRTYLFAPIVFVVLSYISILYAVSDSLSLWETLFCIVSSFAVSVLLMLSFGLLMYNKSKNEMASIVKENPLNFEQKLKTDVLTYTLHKIVKSVQILLYPCLLLITLLAVNHLTEIKDLGISAQADLGFLAIISICAITVFTDMFALFVGITVKGPKLCPRISPKKTISGAIGGFLGGTLASIAVFYIFNSIPAYNFAFANNLTVWSFVLLGTVGAVASEIGDLVASVLKRKVGIKDYGTIFIGQGGFMDRLDSIMLNSAWVLIFFLVVINNFA